MIALSSLPLAYLAAEPFADRIFKPLNTPGGALVASPGPLLGTGPGRGVGLLFIILGVARSLTVLTVFLYPRLLQVEIELPDAIPTPSPAGVKTSD